MRRAEISFDETNIISRVAENDYKKRKISKKYSNRYLIIWIILLILLAINLYQSIKIEKQKIIFQIFEILKF